MSNYSSDVRIVFDGRIINGKSIVNILSACIKCGSKITVECRGDDEQEMFKTAKNVINRLCTDSSEEIIS